MLSSFSNAPSAGFEAYRAARRNMVEGQLRACGVRDERVLTAMEALQREPFVPAALQSTAYRDADIEIAPGRYLMAPMVLARLIQAANVSPQDVVLDIAPGSGYATALLAALARQVVGLEADSSLCAVARHHLELFQTQNAVIEQGDLLMGWRGDALYNVILIEGAVSFIPDTLFDLLADGGRLVCVYRDPASLSPMGQARVYVKNGDNVSPKVVMDAYAPPLAAFLSPGAFVL